jgi:two-component system, LuxR family, response regulator FixJ
VINDDEPIRKSLARLFCSANFNAETYISPDNFLSNAIQKENACVLMNIRMPNP